MSSTDHLSELESLRSQVADLSRALAERDQSMSTQRHQLEAEMQDLREQSHLLHTIIEGTATETGEEFLASLVTYLTSTLHVQYAVIGEVCEGQPKKIRTLAVSAGGTLVDNFEYELAYTPCATALTQSFACFDRDVQAMFPQFHRLTDFEAESYCAVPLRTKDGAVMGLLVVMDTKPMQRGDDLQSLLGIFAPRVVAEFERRRAEQERAQALADLHNVMETIPDVMFTLDTQGNMVKWNRRVVDVTGYSPEELLNKSALVFVPPEEQARTASAIQRAFMEGYAELEGNLLTKEHRLIPYHWTGALLKNAHGEPIGIIGVGRDVSEKKRTEEALRKVELHYRTIFEQAGAGVAQVDSNTGRFLQVNRSYCEVVGLTESEMLSTTVQAITHPDDLEGNIERRIRLLSGEIPSFMMEKRYLRKDGSIVWVSLNVSPLWRLGETPVHHIAIVQDITERKRAEEALRASEERWQLAVRGSNDGIWDWNIQTGEVFFSARWKAMRGFEDHEIKNHVDEWRSRIHPDGLNRVLQSLDAYLAKQVPEFCEEYRVQRKDGSYMWVLDRGVALWADDGTLTRMTGSETDITEYRQALASIAEQESLLHSILDTEPECVKRVAEDGTLLQMNKAGLCFIESDSFGQVAGRSVYDLVAPEFLERYRSMHEAVIGGASQQLEFQIVGLKGTRRWMETHAVPLQNPIDHRVEQLAITRDISERKRVEEALRESEHRFALAVAGSTDILWDAHRLLGEPWYAPQTPIWWSPRVRELLGLEESEPFETLEQWAVRLHPDDKDCVFGQLAAHIDHRVPYDVEYRLRTNRGDYRWVRGRGQAIWDEQGEPRRMSGSCQDITERRINEQLLVAEKRILEMIAIDAPLQEVLPLLCRAIEECSNGALCSILLLDPDGLHLRHGAAPSFPEAYVNAIDGMTIGPTACSCGTAAFTRRQVIVSDIARDPLWADFHDLALRHGLRACWSTPVISSAGIVLGTFAVYCREPQQPTHADLLLVERASHIACIAIERKRTEEALHESRQRLYAIVEGTSDAVFIKDLQGRYLLFNEAAGRFVGKNPGEVLGHDDTFIFLHDDANALMEKDREVMVGGKTITYEEHLTTADGSRRTFSATKAPLLDVQGVVSGLFGISRDITERKEAEEALRRSERQLRTVLDALPLGVWFTDQLGKPVLSNPAAKRIWSGIKQVGIETAASAAGWWETVGPSSQLHRWALSQSLTKGIPSLNETLDIECLDGTRKAIRNTTVPVRDEAGVIVGTIVLNEDMTALRDAQEAIKLTQFSIDHAVEGFFWIDPDARILNVNDSACRMLEYSRDELTTMTLHDIEPNLPPELWSARWEVVKQKGAMTFESKHWSKTGRVLDAEVTINYLCYEGREYNCAIVRDIGERKRTETSLRQSEERYRSLVDNAPIGIFVNEAGRFAYVNREMQRILKAPSAEQLIGTPVLERIAPEFHAVAKDRMRELIEKGQAVPSLDEEFVRFDGSRVDVAVTAIPTSFNGTIVMQVLVLDITNRKQADAALRASEERYRTLYDDTPTMYFTLATDGTVRSVNRFGADQLGYLVEELIGHSVLEIFHEDDKKTVAACLSECLATPEKVSNWEFRKIRRDGHIIWVRETASVVRSPTGETIVLVTCEDITDRKQVAEALRQSHAFLRQVIDIDPHFIFAKDRAGQFRLVNKAVADVYGTTVDQLIGKTDADFNANPDEIEFFRLKDLEVMDSLQERFIPEEAITDSTGKTRWLQTLKRPILDEQGCAIMILGASTDITDRKRVEEALRQKEIDLRVVVEERERISQDLHDGVLQSLFAVGLTLETAKLMMSPRGRKTSGPPIDQAIDQLNRVMHEIRNFIAGLGSDLLTGKDLPTALRHMLELLGQTQETRVRLMIEDRATQALSTEQSLHLLLIIQEAVSNCIKHGHAQEATVSLKMLKQGIRLSIRDNGCGFNPKAARRTGHGLSNMAARAKKIGGRFTLMSKVNQGTRIMLDLPKEVSGVCK